MVEQKVRLLSEGLARTMDRRKLLQSACSAAFMGMAALVAGHTFSERASAHSHGRSIVCTPPGPYCNLDGNNYEPSGCNGASCFQHLYYGQVLQCRVYYGWFQAGCWTNVVKGGYWVCCDCECGQPRRTFCGCAQFSGSPKPRPDSPVEGGADA